MELIPLANGISVNTSGQFRNGNILVVGSTGSGKTMSIAEPRILHTNKSSLVIPITKRKLFEKYAPVLKKRGYRVYDLNLSDPEKSGCGYDPLRNRASEKEIIDLARNMMLGNGDSKRSEDSYWTDSAASGLSALMILTRFVFKDRTFGDFLQAYNNLRVDFSGNGVSTSLDEYIEEIRDKTPKSPVPRLWDTFSKNAPKTAACIYSEMNCCIDKFFSPEMLKIFNNSNMLDIGRLGKEKSALFITSQRSDVIAGRICSILYDDIFRTLLKDARKNGGALNVPVHIIADDFACGSKIPDFDSYISVFREAGLSATILLQSISQLESMYSPYQAKTITDNCDTYIYMGNLDIRTCEMFSRYADVPLQEMFRMPIGKTVIIQRGEGPIFAERYSVTEDIEYKKAAENEKNI